MMLEVNEQVIAVPFHLVDFCADQSHRTKDIKTVSRISARYWRASTDVFVARNVVLPTGTAVGLQAALGGWVGSAALAPNIAGSTLSNSFQIIVNGIWIGQLVIVVGFVVIVVVAGIIRHRVFILIYFVLNVVLARSSFYFSLFRYIGSRFIGWFTHATLSIKCVDDVLSIVLYDDWRWGQSSSFSGKLEHIEIDWWFLFIIPINTNRKCSFFWYGTRAETSTVTSDLHRIKCDCFVGGSRSKFVASLERWSVCGWR